MMAKVTGRKTFYEDNGKWVIEGDELLDLLRQRATEWNWFRHEHKRYRPILNSLQFPSEANFQGYDFSDAVLVGGEFETANFGNAQLINIDAKAARFENCSFKSADLSRANFFNARFTYCNFTDCDLADAFLVRAIFRHCKMDGANFTSAEFGETDFINVSLSGARGLGKSKHESPSNLDLATLKQSLPIWFLRGVGLSEELISAQPLFGAEASSYYSCFISFSTKD